MNRRTAVYPLLLSLLSISAFASNPQISGLSPVSGAVGTQVQITGSGFGLTQGSVTFNGSNATVVSWSDTQVTTTVPSAATTGAVQVTAGGVGSNANVYFTVPAPKVTSISPTSGVVGAQITVNGSGFQASKGSNSLVFNNLNATIVSWSDSQIIATIPSGVTTGPVYTVVNGIVSNQDVLLTMPNPVVTSVSPSSGPVSTQVQVNGSGFGTSQGSSTIAFVAATGTPTSLTVTSWSDAQITATVPTSAVTGYVRVVEGGVTSNTNVFFTIPSPQITSLAPSSGVSGTHVTISGSGFQAIQGSGSVTFNNHTATIVSWTDTQIVATAPSATLTGPIKVTTGPNALASNSDVIFTFPNPLVTSVSPTSGPVQTQVQINGSGFGATQGTSTVTFDNYNPTVTSWGDTQIACTVPANASAGQIRVSVSGVSSNSNVYFTIPAPRITSLSPTSGIVGAQLTITGTGFQSTRGSGSVSFTGNSGSSIVSWSDTQIVVTVPASATTGPVQVRANNGVASNNDVVFTMPRPYVAGVAPSSGPVGSQVTITGSGFGASQGTSTLTFDTYTPAISSWSDSQIVATVPAQTSAGQIKVVEGGVTSNTNVYFTVPTPQITSISPASGVVGTQVTINGSGFQSSNGSVSFNSANATINSWSDTQVVVTVPASATSGPVLLRGNNGVSSNQDQIFSMPNPKVISAVPSSGSVGTQVTINGTGFGATQGTSSISFVGFSATVSSWSDTQIVATVPTNASTGAVRVTVGGVLSNNNVNFTIGPVTVGSLSPTAGAVGSQVTVTGSGFGSSQGTSTITFNNVAATVSTWSATQIVATVPSSATSGPVKVTVGTSSSNTDRVFSVGLVVTSISPTSGIVGTQVTINGSGFGSTRGSNYVTFNNYSGATITSWSSTQIVATVTSGCTAGPVKVVIGSNSSNQDQIFTMPNPVITGVVPSSGPVGTQVQINGSGFGSTQTGSSVTFNSANATITSWSDTQIAATVPATATTGLVKVTAGGVAISNTNNVYFTIPQPHVTSLSPTSGAAGTQVTITGSGFLATQGSNSVVFNVLSGTVTSWSDTQIVATVQSGSSSGPVTVRVNGVSSNQDVVFTMPNPVIGGLVPSSGARGTQVQINGSGFGATQGSSTIQFNGVTATATAWSDSQITATVPATSTTGPVKVTAGGVASNNNVNFTIPAPAVTSISPSTGLVGTQVTISGTGFGATQGTSFVRVNAIGPTITSWSDTQIVATIATGTTTGPVSVNVQGIGSNQDVEFTLPNPIITRLTPSAGAPGTQVQITGSGFGATQGSNTVTFTNGVTPTVSSWSDSQITATVPGGAVTGPITVVNSGVTSNTNINFTVPAPQVATLSPNTGAIGTQVTVNGSGFHATQGSSTVSLNGGSITASSWSDTQIVFTVPTGANGGPIKVTVNGVDSNQDVLFTLPKPVVTGVTPSNGAMNTQVQISGSGFGAAQGGSTLNFYGASGGTVPATASSWSDTTIVATVPSAAVSGPLKATVGGVNSPANVYFTVPAPQITSLTPNVGGGGNPITIAGTGFQPTQGGNSVSFSGGVATANTWSDTQIQGTVPANVATGPVRVFVNNVPSNYFNYTVPNLVISSLSPTTGPVGTQVTIAGSGFGATQGTSTFYFNGQPATVSSWSDTQIVATVPVTATTGPTLAQVNTVNSNQTVVFTVPPPVISNFSPAGGGTGQQFTITGTGFQANQRDSTVTIHGTAANIVSWSDTQIVAMVATGTTTGPLNVTVNGISGTFASNFEVPNPVVTSITPPSAAIGGTIKITGSGFLSLQYQGSQVAINGIPLNVGDTSNWSDTTITAKIPASQPTVTSGPLAVTVFNETSNSVPFTIEGQPNVTSLTPITGTIGATVTIAGSGFGSTQSTSTVNFNGVTAPITSWSDSEIQATVPANATTGPVAVTVAGLAGQTANFEIGSVTQMTDSAGNVTTYNFVMEGGTWHGSMSQGSGCSSCTVRGVTQRHQDSLGNTLDETDALGHKTTYTYDSYGNILTQSQPLDANTNATWVYTYNSFGEVLTAQDPIGNVTTNTYDPHGNLLTVTTPKPDANTAASVTQFGYNSLGELTTITDPLTHVTTLTYTPAGLIQTITDAQNNVTTYGYDTHGNRTSVIDAMQHETDFAYDTGDRLSTITYPDHTTTGFGYDYRGRRTSVTDQNGKTTTYAYDDADRLTSVTDATNHVTQYGYDDENNLVSITDANNHITSFQYDPYSRVSETDFPSGHAESYIYDAIGNLVTKTDRNGNAITYVYDALNRLTHKGYPDSTGVDYIYDLVGKVKQVTDPTGTYGFAYDNMGRLIGTSTAYSFLPGQNYTNNYTYDAASNRTGFTAPDGSTNTYVYDSLNRLSTLTNSLAGQFGFGYDGLSRRTSLTRPNGVNTAYSYDSLSRLLSILHQAGGATIDGANYTLDSAGNRTSKQNWLNGITENYTYDPIYQLTQVDQLINGTTSTTESYAYDSVGNRLSSLSVGSYTYNNSNQLTSSSDGYSYTYDANGNSLTKSNTSGTTQYVWDFENRLISVTLSNGGGTVVYRYDPFGRRIQKSASGGTTVYLYDGDDATEELDGSGTLLARYAQTDNIDEVLAIMRSGATNYYHSDGLSSITSLSTAAGALAETYRYNAFGNLTANSGPLTNSLQYSAREFDSETGMFYLRARYYDSKQGRFISEDPIRFSAGNNFYAYVKNQPINFNDPSGKLQLCCRPARSVTWLGLKGCHCFLKLSDGTTLGGYFGPTTDFLLEKRQNDNDDLHPKDKPGCSGLPGSECNVRQAFNDLPKHYLYGIAGTSNSIPARTLEGAGIPFRMPSCAWGAYPFNVGSFGNDGQPLGSVPKVKF